MLRGKYKDHHGVMFGRIKTLLWSCISLASLKHNVHVKRGIGPWMWLSYFHKYSNPNYCAVICQVTYFSNVLLLTRVYRPTSGVELCFPF